MNKTIAEGVVSGELNPEAILRKRKISQTLIYDETTKKSLITNGIQTGEYLVISGDDDITYLKKTSQGYDLFDNLPNMPTICLRQYSMELITILKRWMELMNFPI